MDLSKQNTDVKYRGVVYHVQTEDKGTANPLIETLIYKGGEILGSRRLPYAELASAGDEATFVLGPLADGTYTVSAARRDASGALHATSAPLTVTVSPK